MCVRISCAFIRRFDSQTDLVAKQRKESPAQAVCRKAAKQLVTEAVLVRGAKDNVTAIVILFDHGTAQPGL